MSLSVQFLSEAWDFGQRLYKLYGDVNTQKILQLTLTSSEFDRSPIARFTQ